MRAGFPEGVDIVLEVIAQEVSRQETLELDDDGNVLFNTKESGAHLCRPPETVRGYSRRLCDPSRR